MRLAPSTMMAAVTLLASHAATASPAAYDCDRTIQEISQAKTIVVAKAKAVVTTLKDKRWIVRVTYAVEQTLVGKESPEIVVEEDCLDTPIPESQLGYPGVLQHCVNTQGHLLPGLGEGGKIAPVSAALVLTEKKSELDGKPVTAILRQSPFLPCADITTLLKTRPELEKISKQVMDTNGKTQFGLPPSPSMPPPVVPSASVSTSASASASAPAAPSVSAKPSTVPVTTAPPPAKSGGCGCTLGTTTAAPWPLLAVVLAFARRRRQ